VSIEFKKGEEKTTKQEEVAAVNCCAARGLSRGDYHEEGCASLPRNNSSRLHHQVYHKKQPSLPGKFEKNNKKEKSKIFYFNSFLK
jgi:hypothetical protein